MSADPRTVDGAVYPHKSDDSGRGNRLTHHRGRVYRLGGFCYIFRRIGGTWERNSLLTDFPLPVCSGHHPGCVFTQQVFRSGWRLECVLDHGSDLRGHFPYHLPQGDCKTCDDGPKGMNAVLLDCAGVTAKKVFFALHHVGAGGHVCNKYQRLPAFL